MLEKIVQYAPPALKKNKICRGLFWALFHCINFRLYIIDRLRIYLYHRCHSSQLKKFKDIHKGQRCFIIGTGPSLNQTNLSLLKDEIIFGVNTLYTGLTKLGITCDYYAVSDGIMWRNNIKDILGVDATLFLGGPAGREYLQDLGFFRKYKRNKPIVIRQLGWIHDSSCFSRDISKGHYVGSTVIIDMCLQMAYYMGFKEVYLLGCDCDFSGSLHFSKAADPLNADGMERLRLVNPSHTLFTDDWSRIFESYEMCKKVYEEGGREIINATVGGKLEVFKRMKLEEII